jgi:hypothetical protein
MPLHNDVGDNGNGMAQTLTPNPLSQRERGIII